MIYSAHQPDLLPYSGFWYKLAHADIFDLKIFDQFQNKPGYQRRVKMHNQWVGVTAHAGSSTAPINQFRIDPSTEPDKLLAGIRQTYGTSWGWEKYGGVITDRIMQSRTPLLWQFNLELILMVRDLLGITTPIGIGVPHEGRGSAGIVETIQAYSGVDTYLSGEGGRSYMGDCKEFTDAGIEVVFSKHKHVTGDSILTVLMDHDDPMATVMAEHEGEAG